MRRGCVIIIIIFSAIAFVLSVISFIFFWPKMKKLETSRLAAAIEVKLEEYRSDQGDYPPGDGENAQVMRALHLGQNPREKVYLQDAYVRDGQLVDFWKTPLRIEFAPLAEGEGEVGGARVTSAGPNETFGDDDDITSQLIKDEIARRAK